MRKAKVHYITSFTPTLRLPVVACGAQGGVDSSTNPRHTTCWGCRRTRQWRIDRREQLDEQGQTVPTPVQQ